MVLLSFSEPVHVRKILDGRKTQTTRQERKNPIKVGDTLQVYYKSRCKKDCMNCIHECPCTVSIFAYSIGGKDPDISPIKCSDHTNFFGTATVTSVETIIPDKMSAKKREAWAKADGFDSWISAALWFGAEYGKKFENWRVVPWTVVKFAPDWLKGGST